MTLSHIYIFIHHVVVYKCNHNTCTFMTTVCGHSANDIGFLYDCMYVYMYMSHRGSQHTILYGMYVHTRANICIRHSMYVCAYTHIHTRDMGIIPSSWCMHIVPPCYIHTLYAYTHTHTHTHTHGTCITMYAHSTPMHTYIRTLHLNKQTHTHTHTQTRTHTHTHTNTHTHTHTHTHKVCTSLDHHIRCCSI
jgi:hypothetical protein